MTNTMCDRECSICLSEVEKGSKLDCGHYFHLRCLEQFQKQTCPVCRQPHQIPIIKKAFVRDDSNIEEDRRLAEEIQRQESGFGYQAVDAMDEESMGEDPDFRIAEELQMREIQEMLMNANLGGHRGGFRVHYFTRR